MSSINATVNSFTNGNIKNGNSATFNNGKLNKTSNGSPNGSPTGSTFGTNFLKSYKNGESEVEEL